ncbi:PAS domain S-box protein [Haloarchaeobius sp. DFWS5]|uniref:PAS domain S-box protein n=1 Tax=Haloarchaeobius sp. DFWS5 TaxID=3446114 RepID=UPI003EB8A118
MSSFASPPTVVFACESGDTLHTLYGRDQFAETWRTACGTAPEDISTLADIVSSCCVVGQDAAGVDLYERLATNREPPAFVLVASSGDAVERAEAAGIDHIVGSQSVTALPVLLERAVERALVAQAADAATAEEPATEADPAVDTATDLPDTLADHAQDMILVVDDDGDVQYANPAVETVLGYSPESFVGENAFEHVHPDDRESLLETFAGVVYGTDAVIDSSEYRARHADGSWRWLEARGQTDAENVAVDGFVVSVRDVTHRKEREERLRREREFTDGILGSLTDLFFVLDVEHRLRRWNAQVRAVSGRRDVDLTDTEVTELVVPDDVQTLEDALETVEQGASASVKIDLVTDDGREVPHEFTVSPLVIDGEFVGFTGIGRDVRTRERRLRELRESERRFDAVFDDPMAFTGLLAPDGTLLEVNEHACEFIGKSPEEVTGGLFWRLPWWSHSAAEQERLKAALDRAADGEFMRLTTTNVGDGDALMHLDCSFRPVTDDDGAVVSIVAEGIDISEQVVANRERELLLETIQQAAGAETFDDALVETLQRVVASSEVAYGEAWVQTDDQLELTDAWWTDDEDLTSFGDRSERLVFGIGEGLPGRVWKHRESEWVEDLAAANSEVLPRQELASDHGLHSAVGVPILNASDEPVAVLVFLSRTPRERDDRFLELLSSVSTHLGVVLQRRLAQADLDAERERQTRLLETSPVGILVMGPGGEIRRENRRAKEILGVGPDETVTESFARDSWVVTDERGVQLPGSVLGFTHVRESGEPLFNEIYVLHRTDGDRRWLHVNAAPVSTGDGEVIVSFSDITEQKQREQAVENQAERVSVLNRVLRHDLRTNLTIIGGVLDLIEESCDVSPTHVDDIQTSLDDLEAVSRSARRIEDAFETDGVVTVDLARMAENAADSTRETYPDATFEVVDQGSPSAVVHARFHLAFEHLLENAIEHNDAAEPHATVSLDHADGQVVVTVRDNGPGIPEREVDVLASSAETPLEHSSGLGLWFVHWLVSKSDGSVDIDASDAGTVVTVRVPAAPEVIEE